MPTLSLTPVSPGFFPAPDVLQWFDGMLFTDPMVIDNGVGDWSVSPGSLGLATANRGTLALPAFSPGVL